MPDAFMLELMGGITDGLVSNGYDLLVARVHPDDKDWVRRYYDSGRVDGFIATAATCKPGLLKKLAETGAPLIVWGASDEAATHCSVLGDNLTGGRLATAHLVERGRRRIGFLGGPAHDPQVRDRLRGYEAALAEAGVAVNPALVMHVAWGGPAPTRPRASRPSSITRSTRSSRTATSSQRRRWQTCVGEGSAFPRTSRSSGTTTRTLRVAPARR